MYHSPIMTTIPLFIIGTLGRVVDATMTFSSAAFSLEVKANLSLTISIPLRSPTRDACDILIALHIAKVLLCTWLGIEDDLDVLIMGMASCRERSGINAVFGLHFL
jgi:hypothetical protein